MYYEKKDDMNDFEYMKNAKFELSEQTLTSYNCFLGIFSETDGFYFVSMCHNRNSVIRKNSYDFNRAKAHLCTSKSYMLKLVNIDKLPFNIQTNMDLMIYFDKMLQNIEDKTPVKVQPKIDYLSQDRSYDISDILQFKDKNLHLSFLRERFGNTLTYDMYCCQTKVPTKTEFEKPDNVSGYSYICPTCGKKMTFDDLGPNSYKGYIKYDLSPNNDLVIAYFSVSASVSTDIFEGIKSRNMGLQMVFASPEKLRVYTDRFGTLKPCRINNLRFFSPELLQTPDEIKDIISKSTMKDTGLLEAYGFGTCQGIDNLLSVSAGTYLYNYFKKPGLSVLMKEGYSKIVQSVILHDYPLNKKGTSPESILNIDKETFTLLINTTNNVSDISSIKEWKRMGADSSLVSSACLYELFTKQDTENISLILDTVGITLDDLMKEATKAVCVNSYDYQKYFSNYAAYLKILKSIALKDKSLYLPKNFLASGAAFMNLWNYTKDNDILNIFLETQLKTPDLIDVYSDNKTYTVTKASKPVYLIGDLLNSEISLYGVYKYMRYEVSHGIGVVTIKSEKTGSVAALLFINTSCVDAERKFKIIKYEESIELDDFCESLKTRLA